MSYRRQMLEFLSLSRLPSSFQEVEYLESSGTQYIDTGFKPNQDSRMILDYQKSLIAAYRIIGCRTNTTSDAFCWGGTSNTTPVSNMASYDGQAYSGLGSLDTNRHILDMNKNNVYLDNNLVHSFNYINFNGYGNIYIGTINTSYITSNFDGKLYSCKIYDNSVLIRDFVPCYRKADNIAGLYDLVNGVFYTNAGTGDFVVGPDVGGDTPEPTVTDLTGTTWLFNNSISLSFGRYNLNYESDGSTFDILNITSSYLSYDLAGETSQQAYFNSAWTNQAYRTITITGGTDVTNQTLIDWLQANATQVNLISFTINNISYQAEDGMTWYEWCQSAYNTSGWMCGSDSSTVQSNSGASSVTKSGILVVGSDTIVYGSYNTVSNGSSPK